MPTISVVSSDGPADVVVDGPQSPHLVVIVPDVGGRADDWSDLCARLHESDLRTAVVSTETKPTAALLQAIFDVLDPGWVNLVGHGAGAEAAWWISATTFGRVRSLIAIERGHPGSGSGCPPVEVPTTVVALGPDQVAAGRASGPLVYSEFRSIELAADATPAQTYVAELASEISLRSSTW